MDGRQVCQSVPTLRPSRVAATIQNRVGLFVPKPSQRVRWLRRRAAELRLTVRGGPDRGEARNPVLPHSLLPERSTTMDKQLALEQWGGWGSNPRPADYESG
jgi:hypothetical protein